MSGRYVQYEWQVIVDGWDCGVTTKSFEPTPSGLVSAMRERDVNLDTQADVDLLLVRTTTVEYPVRKNRKMHAIASQCDFERGFYEGTTDPIPSMFMEMWKRENQQQEN